MEHRRLGSPLWWTRSSQGFVTPAAAGERGVRNPYDLPRLTIREILWWADAHFARVGRWPSSRSGPIADSPGETWKGIDSALRRGRRGLAAGRSLATLLEQRRTKPYGTTLAPLAEKQILRWADAFHRRTGQWPNRLSGPITEAPRETWLAVENALRQGVHGLKGGSSLVQLLVERRGIRNVKRPPGLSVRQILAWADAYHERTGQWPIRASGAVDGVVGETWEGINSALRLGLRGLRVRSSLADLLAARRRKRHTNNLPALSVAKILRWADAFHARTGRWPKRKDGKIDGARDESWDTVNHALRTNTRGLAGQSSLASVLCRKRGMRSHMHAPPLTTAQILEWAHAHQKRHGKPPTRDSGPIAEAPGETWQAIGIALYKGRRGLPGVGTGSGRLRTVPVPISRFPLRRKPGTGTSKTRSQSPVSGSAPLPGQTLRRAA